jgi:hypothetical protein
MAMIVLALLVIIVMIILLLLITLERRNNKRAGKIGAEHGEEKEFALGIYLRAFGEIVAQMAFGK